MIKYTMLPFQIHTYNKPLAFSPLPQTLTLLYVLSGHVSITGDYTAYLYTQDIITLPAEHSGISITPSIESYYALIHLSTVYVNSRNDYFDTPVQLDSSKFSTHQALKIQSFLQALLQIYFSGNPADSQALLQTLNHFIDTLFECNSFHEDIEAEAQGVRLKNKLNYLLSFGITKQISLTFLSEELHLTPQYISFLSKQLFGIGYSQYLTSLRLDCAIKYLMHTDMNITQIAASCGFPNVKALNQAFQKGRGLSPSQYKKLHAEATEKTPLQFSDNINYNSCRELYLSCPQMQVNAYLQPSTGGLNRITASLSNAAPYMPPQADVAYVGDAKHMLSISCNQLLRTLKENSNIKYVRMNKLFEIDAFSASENYYEATGALSNLLALDLIPFIFFQVLPFNKTDECFIRFFNSCAENFGIKIMKNWCFEYCCPKNIIGTSSQSELLDIVAQITNITRHVKSYSTEIAVGNNFFASAFPTENAVYLCRKLAENNILPDFTFINLYPIHMRPEDALSNESINNSSTISYYFTSESEPAYRLSTNPGYCYQKLKSFRQTLQSIYGSHYVPIYADILLDLHANNLINETLYASTFLLMNMLKTQNLADRYILPALSDDLHFLYSRNKSMLQGINSLYTDSGIPKPLVFVLKFLKASGNMKVASGDSYLITSDENQNITCLLFNYKHPSMFFCNHPKALSPEDVNIIFRNYDPEEMAIQLQLKEPTAYLVEELSINKEHGSILDLWLDSNSVEQPNVSMIKNLKEMLHPGYRFYKLEAQDTIKLTATLETHEIKLIKLNKLKSN